MPVHHEPAPKISVSRLPRKDLREMVVLGAVCIISTIVFVPPLVGIERRTAPPPAIAARDLRADVPLVPAVRLPATRLTPTAASGRVTRVAVQEQLVRREASHNRDERALAAKLGRAITGSGRHRVQPFPRPAEFE
jgi:hypothetical protein